VYQGGKVSLLLPNCICFAVLWFALAMLGAATAEELRAAILASI
jgi:acyl-CoA synthetase (AMP-forming)/AMP-acid ligase II